MSSSNVSCAWKENERTVPRSRRSQSSGQYSAAVSSFDKPSRLHPRRSRAPPSAPVLAYREVVEHPCLSDSVVAIRALLQAAASEEERRSEWLERAVPLPDVREEAFKAAEEEVGGTERDPESSLGNSELDDFYELCLCDLHHRKRLVQQQKPIAPKMPIVHSFKTIPFNPRWSR